MVTKKLKADLLQYVDEKCKSIKPMIDISKFTKEQHEAWEIQRANGMLTQSFVHLALIEGWTRAEAEEAVNVVLKSIPDEAQDAGERKIAGLLQYCE